MSTIPQQQRPQHQPSKKEQEKQQLAEKKAEEEKLLHQLAHRVNTLSDDDIKSKQTITEQINTVKGERNSIHERLQDVKESISEINDECDQLYKQIYFLGGKLKRKVPSKDFEALKEIVDNWSLERFMHHDELERTWQKYTGKN
ncbi:MAG: hypothetical protein ACOCU6_00870 [Nanoarchaeota archaeon]